MGKKEKNKREVRIKVREKREKCLPKRKAKSMLELKVVDFTHHNFGPSKLSTTAVGLAG
jgi:hypothetical protein